MIYIIDDDPFVRRGFGILLNSYEFDTKLCESAENFLQEWIPDKRDLLILDIQMPGMSGCDLLNHLAERGLRPPVIIITAYDEPSSRQCSMNYGAVGFLRKPVDGNVLLELIGSVGPQDEPESRYSITGNS